MLLVVPIDKAAPKGRLILPVQQVLRDLLDHGATALIVRDSELSEALSTFGQSIRLVITDSQAMKTVSSLVPEEIPLTTFSILFARYKGDLEEELRGFRAIEALEDGDTVLIAEGCTHHRQCGDIGTEKIPKGLLAFTKKNIRTEFTSGGEFPEDLTKYKVVIHCGGCMLNEREMKHRIEEAKTQGVPITNYGMVLSGFSGSLKRTTEFLEKA